MSDDLISSFYQEVFHQKPDVVIRAPGRINLIGEHTDYNGGFVLPGAIDKSIWLAIGHRDDQALRFHSFDLQDSYLGKVDSIKKTEKNWANYLLGAISEAQQDGHRIGGVNVAFGGDIPIGAGLSSSAAVECGMLAGLNALFDLRLQKMDIVRLAQWGENQFVGMNCGIMDMFASVMGRADCVVRLDCRTLSFEYFPFHAPDHVLLLCDSRVKHSLVDSEYNTRRMECEEGVQHFKEIRPEVEALSDVPIDLLFEEEKRLPPIIFRRCKFVLEEIKRVEATCKALQIKDFETIGQLMFATHEGLRHGYEVTCPETDFLVDKARGNVSVVGARQMGGGFGGCTLNLIRQEGAADFMEKIGQAYAEKFGLEVAFYAVKLTDGVEVFNKKAL